MIEAVVQVHMTEAEAARDFHAVLERVREGVEVVIEEGHRRIALIKAAEDPLSLIHICPVLPRLFSDSSPTLQAVPLPSKSSRATLPILKPWPNRSINCASVSAFTRSSSSAIAA